MEPAKEHWVGLWLFFGCAVMEPCWKGADSSAAPPRARGAHAVRLLSPQVPGAEDQTALSLEECLRLLEATFPFGDNSEVSPQGPSLPPSLGFRCLPRFSRSGKLGLAAPGGSRHPAKPPGEGGWD